MSISERISERSPRKVVIVDPAFLGDVVFDGPLVRAVRERFPSVVEVGMVVRPPADAIAKKLVGVTRVHVFDKRGRHRGFQGLRQVASELVDYDVALVPHPSPRSSMLVFAARIPMRVGPSSMPSRWFLTDTVERVRSDSFVAERLRLIGEPTRPLIGSLPPKRKREGEGRRIGLLLGSEWETKRWPGELAATFATFLSASDVLVLLGSERERSLYDPIRASGTKARIEEVIGGSIENLLETLSTLDVLVGGDTGPLHASRAMGVPVVALFGPTPDERHEMTERDRILKVAIDCRPCSAHGPRVCPKGHHGCMRNLLPEDVRAAVDSVS